MGDVNCNDSEDKNKILVNLRNMYHTYQLKQLIKFPLRSTLSSQTLIDHFATNQSKFITDSGVFTTLKTLNCLYLGNNLRYETEKCDLDLYDG